MLRRYKHKIDRRKIKVRTRTKGTAERPRLSVFRSNRAIYAQLINDKKQITLLSACSRQVKRSKNEKITKTLQAREVGKILAEKAKKIGITSVVFDRGGYRYHGRVKALAEGAREGGLEF